MADLKVISRISVMTYAAGAKRNLREIAQALGVSHVLEGKWYSNGKWQSARDGEVYDARPMRICGRTPMTAKALREIRRAVELVPLEKDALNGADMIHYSGIVAAWVGEKDLALQNLAKAAQLPGFLTYGRLKLLPWYDPLRGNPRFEKLVADLAPKP